MAVRSKLRERQGALTVGALLSRCCSGASLLCGGGYRPRTATDRLVDTSLVGKGDRPAAAWAERARPPLAGRTVWGAAAVMLGG